MISNISSIIWPGFFQIGCFIAKRQIKGTPTINAPIIITKYLEIFWNLKDCIKISIAMFLPEISSLSSSGKMRWCNLWPSVFSMVKEGSWPKISIYFYLSGSSFYLDLSVSFETISFWAFNALSFDLYFRL